ncbi:type IV secretory system conjugative DNA transfer family protein [Nocardia sp. NPDC050713]|uniref:type IV secretory system conjugative DNA transfer family protein n=1 Tax=Nocardia sp. NPDC050713 TaxID=3154511 RepID=UPI0033DD2B1E
MSRECKPVLTPEDCAPYSPTPVAPAPKPPAVEQVPVPDAAPVPHEGVPAEQSPIDPLMPPDGWQPPTWDLDVPSVQQVLDAATAAGSGAVLAAAAGLSLVQAARKRGLEPYELRNCAAGAMMLPVGAVVLDRSWTAPLELLAEGAQAVQLGGGYIVGGAVAMAITAIPAGWGAAALWWARRRDQEEDGRGRSPKASRRMQRRHAAARARVGREAAKAKLPLTAGWPMPTHVVLGPCSQRTSPTPDTVWSSLTKGHDRRLTIPLAALDQHIYVLGNSGSGKTTMQFRLSAGLFVADWQKHLAGGPRPLLVYMDCGGDYKTSREFVEMMGRLGVQPDRIGLWPDAAALDLWSLKPEEVTETLQKMVCPSAPSDAAQEYFFKSRRRVIRLAMGTTEHLGRPVPPPRSRRELFQRLSSASALKALYPMDKAIQEEIDGFATTKPPMVASVAGMLRDIWDSLGPAIDGGKPFDAYDALFLRIPGTTQKDTARAQAAALLEMLLKYAATPGHGRRIRLILDETAAVNDAQGDIGVIEVLERARKYDMSMVVSAQNVEGLGPDAAAARRIMVAASGGAILMRGDGQKESSELYGTAPKAESTRHTLGGNHGDEGSTGVADTFLVHPDALSEFERGDAVYVRGRRAIWGHITPLDLGELPRIDQTEDSMRAPVEARARLKPVTSPSPAVDEIGLVDLDDEPDLGESA